MAKKRVVMDANIPIDFWAGGMIEPLFQLPLEFLAPDVMITELYEEEGQALVSRGVLARELSGEWVGYVEQLHYGEGGSRVSTVDLFSLALARSLGAELLTGDARLRNIAEREGVTVRGTLWLLDQMIMEGIVLPAQAALGLEEMLRKGRRLPSKECEKRLSLWRKIDQTAATLE